MRPLLLFLLLLLLHLRHSLSSPHRLLCTPTRPIATYRALLSLKSSLDHPRREQPLTLADLTLSNLTLSNLTLAENNLSPSPISPSPRTTSPVPSRLRSPLSPLSASSTSPTTSSTARSRRSSLTSLTSVFSTSIYNNNLTGVLPVSVAHMTNLRHLHLGLKYVPMDVKARRRKLTGV
ncbi:hypothetical protein ACLB2K_031683 [Fragaria x ananassa]